MEDASVEIMGRDGQLQNPEVNMWYLFKISSVGNGGTRTFLDFTHLSVVSVKI